MPKDETSQCFKDVAWLQAFPLSEENVLDYFAQSPFYDRTCNNQMLKMQAQFSSINIKDKLQTLVGIEYSCHYSRPPELFVIKKSHRSSPTSVRPIGFYNIINGVVYCAPLLSDILEMRLSSCYYYLSRALAEMAFEDEDGNVQPEHPLDVARNNESRIIMDSIVRELLKE